MHSHSQKSCNDQMLWAHTNTLNQIFICFASFILSFAKNTFSPNSAKRTSEIDRRCLCWYGQLFANVPRLSQALVKHDVIWYLILKILVNILAWLFNWHFYGVCRCCCFRACLNFVSLFFFGCTYTRIIPFNFVIHILFFSIPFSSLTVSRVLSFSILIATNAVAFIFVLMFINCLNTQRLFGTKLLALRIIFR